jgi:O-antigen/teichoic acid export membrane protein
MYKEFKSLLKNIVIYGFGNVSVKLVGLVLLPLYTNPKLLTVDEYGAMGLLDISSQILVAIFSLSLYSAYARWYWDKDYFNSRKKIFFSCFSTLIVFSAILIVSGIFSSRPLSYLLFDKGTFALPLMLMIIATSMQPLIDFTMTQMRVEEKPVFYISTNITRLVVILASTIYFLKFGQKGLVGIYEAQIIGNILFLIITSKYILTSIEFKFSRSILKEIIKFSLPLALASLSNVLLVVFDRYVLNYKSTLLNVGIYTQGYKIANTTKVFIISSVQLALAPAVFKIMNRPDHKMIYSKIMTWFTIVVVYFSLFLSLFGLEVTKLFTTGTIYWDAYKIIPILSLGIIFGMLKDVSVTGLQITKRTSIIGIMLTLIAIFNLGINMTLIPIWGIFGAAISSVISQMVFFIILFIYAQKYYYIPYRLDKVTIIIITGSILYLIGSYTNNKIFEIRVIVKSILLLTFPIILFFFKVVDSKEIAMIKSLIDNVKTIFRTSKKGELEEKMTRIDETDL